LRQIHRIRVVYLSVLLALSAGFHASRAADVLNGGLLACAKLGDDLERLSCFDRLTMQLNPGSSVHPPGSVHPPAPVSSAAPDMFGARPAETAAAPAGITRTELKSITAHVTALHESQTSGAILELDNGQKWQQLGHEDLLLKVGDRVNISRGAFSSFWLMTEGNRSSHVKRLL
jgi:hypothetical protein